MNNLNTIYIVVEINGNSIEPFTFNSFEPFIACTTYDEAKTYLNDKRKIYGPIPMSNSIMTNPFNNKTEKAPELIIEMNSSPNPPPFFKQSLNPTNLRFPYENEPKEPFFLRQRSRHPDYSYGGHSNE